MKRLKKRTKNKIKVSFILPVYNTEEYVAETIESIINQDIGFEDNCELIIVDDGSTDGSPAICRKFSKQYSRVRYKRQENKGVSAALNEGIKIAKGDFVCFVGSDDILSSNTAGLVCDFMYKNYELVDFANISIELFGAITGPHPLNYKFTKTRVIDIEREPENITLNNGGVFIKRKVALKYPFDENMKTHEDAEMLSRVVLDKMAYGVVCGPVYYYRKRPGSLVNDKGKNKAWYMDIPQTLYQHIFNYSLDKLGYIPEYIQQVVMYDIQWQIKITEQPPLSRKEFAEYKKVLHSILQQINDSVIVDQRYIYLEQALHILSIKYDTDILKKIEINEDGNAYLNDTKIFDVSKQTVRMSKIEAIDGNVVITGWYGGFSAGNLDVVASVNGVEHRLRDAYIPYSENISLGERIYSPKGFTVKVPLKDTAQSVGFYAKVGQKRIKLRSLVRKFTYLGNSPRSYRVLDGYIISRTMEGIRIYKYNLKHHIKKEIIFLLKLLKNRKLNIIFYRTLTYLLRAIKGERQLWLLSDRPHSGGDNAEYLFRYINSIKTNVVTYFAINKEAPSYRELKKIGRVVPYYSVKFKLLFLLSDIRISSMFDEYIINDFGDDSEHIRDMYSFKYVYINHGVLTSDSSRVFGSHAKNITLLTTGSSFEQHSIVSNRDYGYSPNQVVVTGLPRLDPLMDFSAQRDKTILLMPTWRSNLAGRVEDGKRGITYAKRAYSEAFKDSDFYVFYNNLINDPRIMSVLERSGYRIKFCIHPSLSEHWVDFNGSKNVEISTPPHNYVDLLKKGALLVTDYSGVAFDFAYMKKPVIYTQFDKSNLYNTHYYAKGDFSFEKQGFGPVVKSFDDSVNAIIKAIESDCVMHKRYIDRVESFFYKIDSHNAERVYKNILKLYNNNKR